jgi:prepilin-type N-terminal cleavage/methylation domain-containing protein
MSRRELRQSGLEAGFTLLEVLIAMMLIAIAALGVARLYGAALRASSAARVQTDAAMLASQKMEQLLSLTWRFDQAGLGLPESDRTSDVSYDPPRPGGFGLGPSPAGTLEINTPGYADFVDRMGRWVGRGNVAPAAAVHVRRWRVSPLDSDPADSVVIQVLVRAVSGSSPAASADVVMTTVRTRKVS